MKYDAQVVFIFSDFNVPLCQGILSEGSIFQISLYRIQRPQNSHGARRQIVNIFGMACRSQSNYPADELYAKSSIPLKMTRIISNRHLQNSVGRT